MSYDGMTMLLKFCGGELHQWYHYVWGTRAPRLSTEFIPGWAKVIGDHVQTNAIISIMIQVKCIVIVGVVVITDGF